MRVAGALTLIAGLVMTAILALLPVEVSVFGTSVSCGFPVARAFVSPDDSQGQFEQALEQDCQARSSQRLIAGMAVGGITGFGGLMMLLAGALSRAPDAVYVPPPGSVGSPYRWPPPPPR